MSYDVTVSREDPYWVAEVAGVPGGATEARRLADLEVEVRDMLSGLLDIGPDEIDLNWHYEPALGPAAASKVDEFLQTQQQRQEIERTYKSVQHDAVVALRDAGVSLRDASSFLHLSFQRVEQVDREATGGQKRPQRRGKSAIARWQPKGGAARTGRGRRVPQ